MIVFALVVGVICNLLLGMMRDVLIDWTFGWSGFFGFIINQTFAMLGGFALACLLLSSLSDPSAFFAYRDALLPGLLYIGLGPHGSGLPLRRRGSTSSWRRASCTTCP